MANTLDVRKSVDSINRKKDYINPRGCGLSYQVEPLYFDSKVNYPSYEEESSFLRVQKRVRSWEAKSIRGNENFGSILEFFSKRNKELTIFVDGKTYLLPIELKNIEEEIQESKELLELPDNWDGQNASAISNELYNSAISFLIDYSMFVLKNTGIVINAPEINSGRNGNIFLSWRTTKARLAISLEKNSENKTIANYYGDLKREGQPIKGNVDTENVSEFLAYWMKNLV
ncbi:hypothetical protein H0I25_00025 [Cellulophaga sp. HaHa_2_95]|uniref:hypothetical protein n=1 Tax=Cellulophaga sp. HaHa_2_95 TaxID=2745558 RepID=UPI001C4FE9BA|nr:hypothetical protein [Cellulophaga sp. HaHa_2_95]QXP56215.1 hypothetical protein H0I25_00025 [Cellulophaga sp. HaHa_2_95]